MNLNPDHIDRAARAIAAARAVGVALLADADAPDAPALSSSTVGDLAAAILTLLDTAAAELDPQRVTA